MNRAWQQRSAADPGFLQREAARMQKYREEHPHSTRAAVRKYQKANPDVVRAASRRYREKKRCEALISGSMSV